MLSRKDYAKTMADPKRSNAAKDGAWKRTMNERRIAGLEKQRDRLAVALQAIVAELVEYQQVDKDHLTFELVAGLIDDAIVALEKVK